MSDTDDTPTPQTLDSRIIHLAYAAAIVTAAWLIATALNGQLTRPMIVAPIPSPPSVHVIIDRPDYHDGVVTLPAPAAPDPGDDVAPNPGQDSLQASSEPK